MAGMEGGGGVGAGGGDKADKELLNMLYRVRRTACEMLVARDYLLERKEVEMTKEDFEKEYVKDGKLDRENLTAFAKKKDDPTEQIFVFFPDEAKVGVAKIKKFAERMKNEQVFRAIMVVQQSLTPFAKQCLVEMAPKYILEVFQEQELLVNITRHTLVPTHQILSDDEKKTLLERYKVKETQLPRVQHSDPVARFYGLNRGQVVRIIRPSETAGRYVMYRICV
uniref:DNA-directed RNA polymerases I, II, and III subunit RPABC1 n=1 Tax=Prasinoderma coloniale TaxID=156133 RepID=A0A7R9TM45_9VIRI|mmetsp:Transcript_3251/g.13177  ORF Transcript_3251/g.13177 Transcript_3251/m.13177 type:complete len:224 (+) Transcript_3251:58-729(+)|eukprot:PRCOL_00003323-RA